VFRRLAILLVTALAWQPSPARALSPWPPATVSLWPPAGAPPADSALLCPVSTPPADGVERFPNSAAEQPEGVLVALAASPDEPADPPSGYFSRLLPGKAWAPVCDTCPRVGLQVFVGYDSFRGVTDDGWQNNGIHAGVNLGTPIPWLTELTGIAFQAGGSAGSYNWSGNDYRPDSGAQTQGFITYGLYRRPNAASGWTGGLVQDWMLNNNYGVFSQNPTLSQLRGQIGYALGPRNEIGLWGAQRVLDSTRDVVPYGVGTTKWRAVNQLNFYWHYKWAPFGADTWIWLGKPENDRLAGGGSLGDYVVGALANIPLSDAIGLYTQVQYMHPSTRPGPAGGEENEWNFTTGLAWYPGRYARSSTVAGQCSMPLLSVANNGYFLVDVNKH